MSKKRVLTFGKMKVNNIRNKPVKALRKQQRKAKQQLQNMR